MAQRLVTVLDPADEYPHTPDEASNYNESMYLNAFDLEAQVGGWFRLGNRVNEGYAEMTVCVYLPGGRVGFVYGRPSIDTNERMEAGGLSIDVVVPFEHLRVRYTGSICLLERPLEMADPRAAFRSNPWVECEVDLDVRGVSPMYGGRPVREDGTEPEVAAEQSFAKAHYEQHCAVTGTIRVGEEVIDLDGLGLRDKSWGPRSWQAISWYRWLPMVFADDFAMMLSVIGGPDSVPVGGADGGRDGGRVSGRDGGRVSGRDGGRVSGMVLVGDEYHLVRDATIESDWDEHGYQTAMRCSVTTDHATYEVTGEVLSLIPLRNRRTDAQGNELVTRITEAMTRFECDGRQGIGMSEYLDQLVDGRPIGPDVR